MRFTFAFVALTLLGLAGCGGQGGENKVVGTVKYKGMPLICGYVMLQFDDGNSVNGGIATDGSYSITTPFTGHAKVAVGSPKPSPPGEQKRGGPPVDQSKWPDPAKWVEIPAKYADPNTSGQDATIKSGTNTLNIDLE